MSKTPEEMAEEYRKAWGDEQLYKIRHEHKRFDWDDALIDGFLAGYQAAKDQLADASKVMNSPEKPDSWISVKDRLPEIEQSSFEMRKESTCVLIACNNTVHVAHLCQKWCDRTNLIFKACDCDCRGHDMEQDEWELDRVTHWMSLPEPPKEEK